MNDKQRIVSGLLELQRTDHDGYLAMAAIIPAMMGVEDIPVPEGNSRGAFKRAIRRIRAVQAGMEKDHPECVPGLKKAAALIRREWLHKEATP
ncbi:hypothetical protein [uncultured Oscillibacter sp.]|uniref:hypothetical protein n=1 Tax=uncultured Oscillibacter sp. TaxID=876091 RepID=UPI0026188A05|nr:hypothetical protein [uncultured Oscillibacter sp.]